MKRCPTCNRTFTDAHLSFCIDDGTPLQVAPETVDEITVVNPSAGRSANEDPQTKPYAPRDWTTPAYLPPGSPLPGEPARKKRVWPWVVGIFGILVIAFIGLGVAAIVYFPKILTNQPATNNRNARLSNSNTNVVPENGNTNTTAPNSNANVGNENANRNSDENQPPADHADVLSSLTDLEHDWTVANINADKKALDRILADDYVATTPNGQTIGKAEYLTTIQRDTTTDDWKFEDLKLDLKGPRATLSGAVKFRAGDRETVFNFVDKFVWREGRWQATGSELTQVS